MRFDLVRARARPRRRERLSSCAVLERGRDPSLYYARGRVAVGRVSTLNCRRRAWYHSFSVSALTPSDSSTCVAVRRAEPVLDTETIRAWPRSSAQPGDRLLTADGRPRGARYRSSSHHRGDAACPVGDDRRLADARVASRDAMRRAGSPISSSTCSSRAPTPDRPRTSRRRSIRSAASSTRSPRRSMRATTSRCSTSTCRSPSSSCPTSSCVRRCRGRGRAREEGHPRRDQDGRGHA